MSVTKERLVIPAHVGLSLTAGVIILISGFVFYMWHFALFPTMSPMMGPPLNVTTEVLSIGIITCGAIIIATSVVMYKTPSQSRMWGAFVIVFSAISILEMGGFLIVGVIGIIGVFMAITYRTMN
jgi:hypothetical protein